MTNPNDPSKLRQDWIQRQAAHGNQPRAVLMKGLHSLLNASIDQWHKQVLRTVFSQDDALVTNRSVLDIGCGFGRLAYEARDCGLEPIGIDFTPQFCVEFLRNIGPAVCGDLSRLPFSDGSFANAYTVTSLMYVSPSAAHDALHELDRCLAPGARILVLEPCREFNALVRSTLRNKRHETLAVPGFSLKEMREGLAPDNWQPIASGCARWLTMLLPLLALATRVPKFYSGLAALALRLDRPSLNGRSAYGRIAMYRWVAYRKEST